MDVLDLSLPLPARSRLYAPEPVGFGTGMVESLASYLARIAEAHWVRVSDLMGCMIAKTTDDRLTWDHQVLNLMGWRSHELNGTEQTAQRWSTLVADQTRRHGMDQLTLLPWRQVLTPRALTHTSQRWCPQCLEEWRTTGRPVYWPLLWSLRIVTVCPMHRIPLERRCPHCQVTVPTLTACGRIGFCPKCDVWLGRSSQPSTDPSSPEDTLPVTDSALPSAQGALNLLAASALIQEEIPRDKLGALFDYCLQSAHCPQVTLAKRLNLAREMIPQLIRGERRVTIPTLLNVLARLGLRIDEFVAKPVATLVTADSLVHLIAGLSPPPEATPPTVLRPGQHPTTAFLAEIQALLETALAQNDPPGLPTLARRAGLTTRKVLWSHFPHLCQAIQAKRKRRLNREKIRRVLKKVLSSAAAPPSQETIAARLKISPITLRKYFPDEVAALRAQRRTIQDVAVLRHRVEAFLQADPPLPLSETSRRLDVKMHHIVQHCPELRHALVARFKAYQHARAVERERQAIAAVRAAVSQVHARGELPTKTKVATILYKNRRAILTKTESEAFHAMMSELGLWQL
jgi:transcriptional regulator with XRE-family HTH domain